MSDDIKPEATLDDVFAAAGRYRQAMSSTNFSDVRTALKTVVFSDAVAWTPKTRRAVVAVAEVRSIDK